MSEINFEYIGWAHGLKDGTKNDKVWVAFEAEGAWYAGWGARGKSIRFKRHIDKWALMQVKRKKAREYDEVDEFQLFSIFPNFKEETAQKLVLNILMNKVM